MPRQSTVDVSAVSSNGATGTIIFCTYQDPNDRTFTGKEGMLNFHGSQSGRITEEHNHGIECAASYRTVTI